MGVVVVAFVCLLWDLIQPDHVMIGALATLMAAGVVSVEEGLAGFANEGLLTVAVLFVVAAGISATGGLDWYMGKLLGHPRTIAGAQLRLMLPIAAVSGFLNNTPVVAVMIPIVQRWAENIHIPKEQVMIPLSFASILGGTCTLIGTSTNLVVLGMLREWDGADGQATEKKTMGLFDLGLFGVPCALSGMCYIMLASRSLLPGGRAAAASRSSSRSEGGGGARTEDLIVGARLQPWSAAVGKTVAGSGLRGLPGLYLVSVKRDDVLMRAVGPEFVLAQGDVLYFTGLVESLGRVCAEYGLMAITSEHDSDEDSDSGEESDSSPLRRTGSDGQRYDADGNIVHQGEKDGADADRSHDTWPPRGTAYNANGGANGFEAGAGTRKRPIPLELPSPVPEGSELLEIQMLARSQAIGGGMGSATNSKRGGAGRKGGRSGSGGKGVGGEDGETSGAESDSGFLSDGAKSDSDAGPSRARRPRISARHSSDKEITAAVAVDQGEKRSLKIYRRRSLSRDGEPKRKHRMRPEAERERKDHEVSDAAAEKALGPPRVTVEPDPEADPLDPSHAGRMVLGISTPDRPGLLHDISQGLNRLQVQLLHCEASVVAHRSVSIWRLQVIRSETTRDEIVTIITSLLAPVTGVEAVKKKGLSVLRVRVRNGSGLVGKTPAEVDFRATYGAAIIAMQRGGRKPEGKLAQVRLQEGDSLVLQVQEDSPLLVPPPPEEEEGSRRTPKNVLGNKLSASMGDIVAMAMGSSKPGDEEAGEVGEGEGAATVDTVEAEAAETKAPVSLKGISFRSRNVRPPDDGAVERSASMNEIRISVSEDGESAGPSEATATVGGSPTGMQSETASVAKTLAVNLAGISLRSDPRALQAKAESADVVRRVRMAHADFEVTRATAGAAGTEEAGKEFLIAVRVTEGARNFIKKTADEGGLRSLPGLFLVSIERQRSEASNRGANGASTTAGTSPEAGASEGASTINPKVDIVDPSDDPLEADDVLWYAGNASSIAMIRKVPGLAPYSSDQVDKLDVNSQERRLIQAVVAKTGPLVGKSIRDIKFRSRFNAVVLAVHREGARVHARVGDVVLHPGDVLLLDAGPDFHREASTGGSGFALVSVLEDSAPPRLRLLVPVIVIAVAMISVYTAGVMNLLIAAIFAAGIMMVCGALSEQEARDAIKWDVIVTIAAAFGMSRALQNSGVAGTVAAKLVDLAELSGTGRAGLLVAVYFATFLISNVVTNNAAAALMFPIAAEAAERHGETLESISFLVMLAASASFMSPFGYQTNLMVYGPGGYVFKDFLRFGFPMQVVQLVVSVVVIVLGGDLWWVSWGAAGIVFALVSFVKTAGSPVAAMDTVIVACQACNKRRRGTDSGSAL